MNLNFYIKPEMTINSLLEMFKEIHKEICNSQYCLYCKNNLHTFDVPYLGLKAFNIYEKELFDTDKIVSVIKCNVCGKKSFTVLKGDTYYSVPYDYFNQEEKI